MSRNYWLKDNNVALILRPDALHTDSFILNFNLELSNKNAIEAPWSNCPFSEINRVFLRIEGVFIFEMVELNFSVTKTI